MTTRIAERAGVSVARRDLRGPLPSLGGRGGPTLVKRISQRSRKAVEAMLSDSDKYHVATRQIGHRYHTCSDGGRNSLPAEAEPCLARP